MAPVAIVLVTILLYSQITGSEVSGSTCSSHKTCGTCIAAGCFWCSNENYTLTPCDTEVNLATNGCDNGIMHSKSSVIDHGRTMDSAQLSPQNITIRLRPGTNVTFNVTFHQPKNYPVDLYFLMDVSYTMAALRDKLVTLSETLASTLHNLTNDYQLGLGSFVDKRRMPYINVERLDTWCLRPKCTMDPYSFRNHLPLTSNVPTFRHYMNSTGVSGNLDSPEAVLDALMQTIECTEHIGWRNKSRKLVVVSTDDEFHYAGDGLLGGLIEPNDGLCHLRKDESHIVIDSQDYPSVSQLARKVMEKKVNVIFAVVGKRPHVVEKYKALHQRIEGSSVGILTNDFVNIIKLVEENYQKISGEVNLKVEKSDDVVDVTFQSKCLGEELKKRSVCAGVGIDKNVTFLTTVHVDLASCPAKESDWLKTLYIAPFGFNDKLTINIELDCRCPCEKSEKKEYKSLSCSGNGARECGICLCSEDFYGKSCECSHSSDNELCRSSATNQMCGGRGKCNCGKCECDIIPNKQYSGKFCECDDHKCGYEYDNGTKKICGGDKRGNCKCGKCECLNGWTGSRCECTPDTSTCTKDGKVCNNKGKCNCGECSCSSTYFSGKFCDECDLHTCGGKSCKQYGPCVRCRFSSSSESECSAYCPTHVAHTDSLGDLSGAQNASELCVVDLDDVCQTTYIYEKELDRLRFIKTKTCVKQENTHYIVAGVVIGIVLVGIAVLCAWKVCVTLHDRREYARFEDEKKKSTFSQTDNPLYKSATSTYKNPAFLSGKQ